MHPEDEALMTVVSLMALSARTAPKAKGVDSIKTRIIPRSELPSLAARMREVGSERNLPSFLRDAGNISAAGACLVIGVTGREPLGLNCQGCGYGSCEEMAAAVRNRVPGPSPYQGPNCIFKVTDLGIAVGSAVRTAANHSVDNRVMYSVGVAALSHGLLPDCSIAFGIPVSATGKNIFFDRT
jgi:uncharacterized ferredoxin-like protein